MFPNDRDVGQRITIPWMHSPQHVVAMIRRAPSTALPESELQEMFCGIHTGLAHIRIEPIIGFSVKIWRQRGKVNRHCSNKHGLHPSVNAAVRTPRSRKSSVSVLNENVQSACRS